MLSTFLNPLSPKNDQQQFSSININLSSREKAMKLYQLNNKEKMLLSFIKFSQLIIRKMFGDKSVKFACGYWSLGG